MIAVGAPMTVALLTGLAVVLMFMAIWVLLQNRDPVDQRLAWTETAGSRPHPWVPETADGR